MDRRGTIAGVIFDLDGVLVSTDELHYLAWRELADDLGIPFDRAINHRLRGVSRMQSLDIILELATRRFSPAEKLALAERKNETYRRSLSALQPADILPGVHPLLRGLRERGCKLAVASSSRNARLILERIQLEAEFDAVVDGNEITRSKPDPEVFLQAAARLGLDPAECVVVEDARAGLEAARRAGMAVFGIGTPASLPDVRHLARDLSTVTPDMLLGAAGV